MQLWVVNTIFVTETVNGHIRVEPVAHSGGTAGKRSIR
jgi:hypothetical protein